MAGSILLGLSLFAADRLVGRASWTTGTKFTTNLLQTLESRHPQLILILRLVQNLEIRLYPAGSGSGSVRTLQANGIPAILLLLLPPATPPHHIEPFLTR